MSVSPSTCKEARETRDVACMNGVRVGSHTGFQERTAFSPTRHEPVGGHDERKRQGGSGSATADREATRQGRCHATWRLNPHAGCGDLDGLSRPRPRTRCGRTASWTNLRDLRPRVVGQDDPRLPRDRRGTTQGWRLRLHRCRARDGSHVRAQYRCRHRQPARLSARQW